MSASLGLQRGRSLLGCAREARRPELEASTLWIDPSAMSMSSNGFARHPYCGSWKGSAYDSSWT
eukprot:scaffold263_cov251-Pinguiococcus_pyrenoidosus.AAC.14